MVYTRETCIPIIRPWVRTFLWWTTGVLVVITAEALHPGSIGDVLHTAAAAAASRPISSQQSGSLCRTQPPGPGDERRAGAATAVATRRQETGWDLQPRPAAGRGVTPSWRRRTGSECVYVRFLVFTSDSRGSKTSSTGASPSSSVSSSLLDLSLLSKKTKPSQVLEGGANTWLGAWPPTLWEVPALKFQERLFWNKAECFHEFFAK